MKKAKKILVMVAALALTAALAIGGTLAYLTSTTEVVQNTFTVGKVAITLDEADVNLQGEIESEERVLGNEYKLMPGHEYIKDPTVTVKADSEESYVRMIVTISDLADVKAAFGADFLPQYFVTGWDNDIWETTGQVIETNDTAAYEFRYYKTVETVDKEDLKLEPLFKTIKVPGSVENEALAALEEMEINVIAYAIQADGFDDAEAAWAAFE